MTTSRRKTEEKEHSGSLPHHQVQKRGTQCEGAGPTREKEGQPPGERKVRKPPRATCGRVSCSNRRPRRKSTAQGRKPSDAPNTPETQQQGSTAGAGQATGARKVAEPPKGNLRQDTPWKTEGAPGRGTEATPEEAQQ